MEKRRTGTVATKSSTLPVDFTKLVSEIFATNFDPGLKKLAKIAKAPARFSVSGSVYSDEVILSISLLIEGQIAATSVHASTDFDPRASSPTVQDLLNACVDAAGALFGQLLDPSKPEKIEQLSSESLGALEDVPFDWSPLEVERHRIFLKIDKANPDLERLADDWLAKHDPELRGLAEEEQRETERLFITGKDAKEKVIKESGGGSGGSRGGHSGSAH